MRRYNMILPLLLLLSVNADGHAAAIDKLKNFLQSTRTAKAQFQQTVASRDGRAMDTASGTMLMSRPGKFRWSYDTPYIQLIVGDGEKLWVYDKDLNQVTVKKLDAALGSTPAALLAGSSALEQSFTLKEGGSKDGVDWVEATPKAQESQFERVRLGFSGANLAIMELTDTFGQTTRLKFTRMELKCSSNCESTGKNSVRRTSIQHDAR